MRALYQIITERVKAGEPFAWARVSSTWGSSPRPVGSALLVSAEGDMAGSVSGGCVEGAVVKACLPLLGSQEGKKLRYGVSNEEAWEVGLSCGGKVEVFAENFVAFDPRPGQQAVWQALQHCWQTDQACVLINDMAEGTSTRSLLLPDGQAVGVPLAPELKTAAAQALGSRKSQTVQLEEKAFFLHVFPPKNRLLLIGAAQLANELMRLASLYGFETTLIDPRAVFARQTHFDIDPDQLFVKYPSEVLPQLRLDAYTYAVVLSHDPKIDDDALQLLLGSDVAYIGALGSRRTHARRCARLREAGFSAEAIDRIHGPVGLDIGAVGPQEIALSIMAEMVAVKNGKGQ